MEDLKEFVCASSSFPLVPSPPISLRSLPLFHSFSPLCRILRNQTCTNRELSIQRKTEKKGKKRCLLPPLRLLLFCSLYLYLYLHLYPYLSVHLRLFPRKHTCSARVRSSSGRLSGKMNREEKEKREEHEENSQTTTQSIRSGLAFHFLRPLPPPTLSKHSHPESSLSFSPSSSSFPSHQ